MRLKFGLLTDIRAETLEAGDQVNGSLVDSRAGAGRDTRDGADKEESVGGELNHFELLKIEESFNWRSCSCKSCCDDVFEWIS